MLLFGDKIPRSEYEMTPDDVLNCIVNPLVGDRRVEDDAGIDNDGGSGLVGVFDVGLFDVGLFDVVAGLLCVTGPVAGELRTISHSSSSSSSAS